MKPFLTAHWRHLAMLNFRVETSVLRPMVPSGTELDSWNGQQFISLVAFKFLQTKVRGWTVPFHRDFCEVNLRFYVRRQIDSTVRRAVVFIREVVPRIGISATARLLYNEPYVALPVQSVTTMCDGEARQPKEVRYSWGRRLEYSLGVMLAGPGYFPESGSLEEFITEHYWGYSRQRNGGTLEYRVSHPLWSVWRAKEAAFQGPAAKLYGRQFADILSRPPDSAFVAEGSAVEVFPGKLIAEP